jgi:S1-C subfamily serine protease
MSVDVIEQFSDALADRVAAAAPIVVAVGPGHRPLSGLLWQPDLVVTSEQMIGQRTGFSVRRGEETVPASLAGRDPGTNVAVLRLATPLPASRPREAPTPRVGSLALLLGTDAEGMPTGRLAMVHGVGPAWHSQAGGRIDALLRLDARLGQDEGGPVLTASGALLGMSTSGPRRRALAIPTATLARVVPVLLAEGMIARGWLGVALQPVTVPESLRAAAGADSGLMVTTLAKNGPAEAAGVLPGDILLDLDGAPARHMRAVASALGPERVGQTVTLRLLRAGRLDALAVTIAARPD